MMIQMLFCLLASALLSGHSAFAEVPLDYFGADHNEADIELNLKVQLSSAQTPNSNQIDGAVRAQLRYMLGLMRSRTSQAAALYPKWRTTVGEKKRISAGLYEVSYTVNSKGLFARGLTEYIFTLPLRPERLAAASQGRCTPAGVPEANYWYHWEPLKPGCPLRENIDYVNIRSPITPRVNTHETYPEYGRLLDAQKVLKVTILFGFEKYGFDQWTPNPTVHDWGITAFNQKREFLKSLGFSDKVWERAQIESIYNPRQSNAKIPYVVQMELTGQNQSLMRVRLVLADSGLYHNSEAFHTFLKDSLANESVVIYSGHSGLGKNLDLAAIESLRRFRLTFNPQYQILFLGSCIPYSYYTENLFARKRTPQDPQGTKNLDIFSYGQEAIFGSTEDTHVLRAMARWLQNRQKTSFQDIIRASPRYYFGISGDEDNPTRK